MIISKTPLRISFVGGGSDLPAYYSHYEGAVLSTAIDKYIYVGVNNKFDKGIRVSYSTTENVLAVQDIEHKYVRNALNFLSLYDDIEIVSIADIPSNGSGLGSSSSFSVGLLNALNCFKGKSLSRQEIAEMACHLEINLCSSPIGKQDQYAAAFGGMRVYKFCRDGSVTEEKVNCSKDVIALLNEETIVFYVGGDRDANNILMEQSKNLKNMNKNLITSKMVDLVWDLKSEFENGSIVNYGPILHANWNYKKQLSSVTNSYLDEIYETALNAGALGGKLLGAGGGGFMLFHVPTPQIKRAVINKLSKLKVIPLNFDAPGTNIIKI